MQDFLTYNIKSLKAHFATNLNQNISVLCRMWVGVVLPSANEE